MISDRKLANVVGGRTARPCDNCIKRRARWYCAADDAFLCQDCDASVHSANPLARRHERVRLKTASNKIPREALLETSVPSWHHGFTRKARTPRHKKLAEAKFEEPARNSTALHLVPEIFSDETSHEEHEEQLLYRVPIFEPFVAELCTSATSNEAANTINDDAEIAAAVENKREATPHDCSHDMNDQLHGPLPSDMDLAEFAADVESLLGQGFDDESFDMERLGLMDCKENDFINSSMGTGKVKVEDEDDDDEAKKVPAAQDSDVGIDVTREPFMLNFEDNSLLTCSEEDVKVESEQINVKGCEDDDVRKKEKKILLRLNSDSVITAWADQKSPWTNGERPEFDSLECWPYCMGTCGKVHHYGDARLMGHAPAMNVGREARVSRYREKRRTRLFSKKIRYEVRKLNAEKRPRMKGRFVKRANFAASSSFPLLNK